MGYLPIEGTVIPKQPVCTITVETIAQMDGTRVTRLLISGSEWDGVLAAWRSMGSPGSQEFHGITDHLVVHADPFESPHSGVQGTVPDGR